ncbi:MAG: polysaccharide pyruvyl transferase family protein [Leptolyngbyaceae bacterium]|nr:polysaccharide pyruvyl transferase family protein [Leptolyngbyaceae bacterium]
MGTTVGLINTYSTLNIGDSAIYSALAAMAPDAQVVAKFRDQTLQNTPGVQVVTDLKHCDAYISVGGDIFNNAREYLITKEFIRNLLQLAASPHRKFVFGQSIPRSCHGMSFWALTFLMRRLAAVCVRDTESHRRLTKAGVKAILSFDSAFSLTVSEGAIAAAQQIFAALEVEPGQAALISLRAFDSMYKHDNAQFQGSIVNLCRQLAQRGHQPVLLLQSNAYHADNDFQVADSITQQVPGLKVFNPFATSGPLANWEVVMGALAIARLIIGVRYHTAVLSLACGRMPFNLYYSNKGRDLTERLGVPGCNLANFQPEAQLAEIEATSDRLFDHAALRQQVKGDFQTCYRKALCL